MKLVEIRWHARGGQGVMVAARTLARAAIREGKYAQGLPEFGPERAGAPVRAYNRISDEPLYLYCAVVNPDFVLVLDPTLLGIVDVTEGMRKGGFLIVNTSVVGEKVLHIPREDIKFFRVDASSISRKVFGRNLPNTVMLGALIKVTEVIKLQSLLEDVEKVFSEKFPKGVVEANLEAIKRGYEEVKIL
jgi:pyruvate ferredoxin oxidoreductase gamma subunit